jgi:hypothetical protein
MVGAGQVHEFPEPVVHRKNEVTPGPNAV